MANKQQKEIRKLNRKSAKKGMGEVVSTRTEFGTNGKKHTVHIERKGNGANAFLEPAQAIQHMKNTGKSSWKINKKHPQSK